MSMIALRNTHASWYAPASGQKYCSPLHIDVKKLKRSEIAMLPRKPTAGQLKIAGHETLSPDNFSCIQDVSSTVEQAKKKYHDASKEHSGARKWLEKISGRIMYYGKVLDSLAQHHPEYVALAWGAVKLVLMASIINRATLVQKLAHAFVAIGDVLPRADLSAELYPTDYMETALSRLYAYIIMFFQLCVRWYNRSPFGRLWSSIKSPYELDYQDLVEQIRQSAAAVDELANAGARAEIRHVRTVLELQHAQSAERDAKLDAKLQKLQTKVETSMTQLIHITTSSKTLTERISMDVQVIGDRMYRIEFQHVLEFFTPATLPKIALLKVQSFARRDLVPSYPAPDARRLRAALRTWALGDVSSLLVVRVAPRAQKQARDLASEVINTLKSNSQAVFWSLSLPRVSDSATNMEDLFKSIIFQIVQHSIDLFAECAEQLNLLRINESHTEREWVDLIGLLLSKIPQSFVVIETQNLSKIYQHDAQWAGRLFRLLQTIVDQANAGRRQLRILLVVYGSALKIGSDEEKKDSLMIASLQAPPAVPPRLKHLTRRSGLNVKGWKFQKSKG